MPFKDPEARKAYLREYHKRWYAEHGDERREQIKQYKRANPSKVKEYRSRPYVLDRMAATKRKWREANRDRDNRNRRIWSKENRDKVQKYNRFRDRREENRVRYQANRDYFLTKSRIRYIVKRDGLTAEQFELMLAFARSKS